MFNYGRFADGLELNIQKGRRYRTGAIRPLPSKMQCSSTFFRSYSYATSSHPRWFSVSNALTAFIIGLHISGFLLTRTLSTSLTSPKHSTCSSYKSAEEPVCATSQATPVPVSLGRSCRRRAGEGICFVTTVYDDDITEARRGKWRMRNEEV